MVQISVESLSLAALFSVKKSLPEFREAFAFWLQYHRSFYSSTKPIFKAYLVKPAKFLTSNFDIKFLR